MRTSCPRTELGGRLLHRPVKSTVLSAGTIFRGRLRGTRCSLRGGSSTRRHCGTSRHVRRGLCVICTCSAQRFVAPVHPCSPAERGRSRWVFAGAAGDCIRGGSSPVRQRAYQQRASGWIQRHGARARSLSLLRTPGAVLCCTQRALSLPRDLHTSRWADFSLVQLFARDSHLTQILRSFGRGLFIGVLIFVAVRGTQYALLQAATTSSDLML